MQWRTGLGNRSSHSTRVRVHDDLAARRLRRTRRGVTPLEPWNLMLSGPVAVAAIGWPRPGSRPAAGRPQGWALTPVRGAHWEVVGRLSGRTGQSLSEIPKPSMAAQPSVQLTATTTSANWTEVEVA
jgi:hypothetical protein